MLRSTGHPYLETRKISHRPITLMHIVCTILERLLKMIVNNEFIPTVGSRMRYSTIGKTHRIVKRVNETHENKQYFSAAFLDVSQASDKV
jgi:hypothetical protein